MGNIMKQFGILFIILAVIGGIIGMYNGTYFWAILAGAIGTISFGLLMLCMGDISDTLKDIRFWTYLKYKKEARQDADDIIGDTISPTVSRINEIIYILKRKITESDVTSNVNSEDKIRIEKLTAIAEKEKNK